MSRSNRGGSLSAGAGRVGRGLVAFSPGRTAALLSRGEGGETGDGARCPPAEASPLPAGGGTTTLDGSGGGMGTAGAGGAAPRGLPGKGGGMGTETIPAGGTDGGSGGGSSGGGSGDRSSSGSNGAGLLAPAGGGEGEGREAPASTAWACSAGEEPAAGGERPDRLVVGLLSTSGTRTSCLQRGQVVIMPAFRRVIDKRAWQ
jgi:hypothetical protein